MSCQVCGLKLNAFTVSVRDDPRQQVGDILWLHGTALGEHDHEPVPVPTVDLGYVRKVCDFCSSPAPQWVFLADSLVMDDILETAKGDTLSARSESDWAACGICKELIDREHYTKLATRAVDMLMREGKIHRSRRTPSLRAIRQFQEAFRRHREKRPAMTVEEYTAAYGTTGRRMGSGGQPSTL
jgi:hypothetical protein